MELRGTQVIAADRLTVWAALNDPETLRACIPGCRSLERASDGSEGFDAVVKQKVGPVSATFQGAIRLEDLRPPESYRIAGEGKGGAAGFAKGAATVRLAEVSGGTELSYSAEAKVGGKLAQLGGRVVDGFARKMADEFFARFKAEVEGPVASDAEAARREGGAPPAGAPDAVADAPAEPVPGAIQRPIQSERAAGAVREGSGVGSGVGSGGGSGGAEAAGGTAGERKGFWRKLFG